jgi:hypothetical protein
MQSSREFHVANLARPAATQLMGANDGAVPCGHRLRRRAGRRIQSPYWRGVFQCLPAWVNCRFWERTLGRLRGCREDRASSEGVPVLGKKKRPDRAGIASGDPVCPRHALDRLIGILPERCSLLEPGRLLTPPVSREGGYVSVRVWGQLRNLGGAASRVRTRLCEVTSRYQGKVQGKSALPRAKKLDRDPRQPAPQLDFRLPYVITLHISNREFRRPYQGIDSGQQRQSPPARIQRPNQDQARLRGSTAPPCPTAWARALMNNLNQFSLCAESMPRTSSRVILPARD